jgi:hypothetical protein
LHIQQTYKQWTVNTIFAAYAWNASSMDGTDVIHSFAAKAHTKDSDKDEPPNGATTTTGNTAAAETTKTTNDNKMNEKETSRKRPWPEAYPEQ